MLNMEYSLAQSFTHTQTQSNIKHHSCSITGLHSVRDSPDPSTLINLGTTTKDLGYFINCCALLDFTSSSSPDGYSPDPSTLIDLDTTAIGLGCILINYCFFLELQMLLCTVGIIFFLLCLHFEWSCWRSFIRFNAPGMHDAIRRLWHLQDPRGWRTER